MLEAGLWEGARGGRRIIIDGSSSCVGKSTLAKAVASAIGATFLDMDDLCWIPGWRRRAPAHERAVVEEATRCESWVCGGIYGTGEDIVYARADTVVILNHVGRGRVISRMVRRTLHRALSGEPCCGGNHETLWSRLRYTWSSGVPRRYDKTRRQTRMGQVRYSAPQAKIVWLDSQAEVDAFMKGLRCVGVHCET